MNEKVLAKVDCLANRLLSKNAAKVVHESPDYVKLRILSHLEKLEKKREMDNL